MLSVNYISNFLEKNQKSVNNESYNLKNFEYKNEYKDLIAEKINFIKNKEKDSYIELYDCLEEYFENNLFGFNKNKSKNNNNIYSFYSSIFGIGDENYYLFNEEEKIKCIKNLIHKMDKDLFIKNYYNEFKYDKNKFFNKEKLLISLKEAFKFKIDENFDLIKKYTADYLGINIIIFQLKNNEVINKYMINSNKYTDNHNKYLPYYFICEENNEFIPIMIKDKDCINYIILEDSYKILNKIASFENHKLNINSSDKNMNIKKLKIDELREYCVNNNINIYKVSEKTGKDIKKTKDELLSEINH